MINTTKLFPFFSDFDLKCDGRYNIDQIKMDALIPLELLSKGVQYDID